MRKKRGPGGVLVDVPSHRPPKKEGRASLADSGESPTDPPNKKVRSSNGLFPEPPTEPPEDSRKQKKIKNQAAKKELSDANNSFEEPKTVPYVGRKKARHQSSPEASSKDNVVNAGLKKADAMADPVAGWLVVTEGPGKGEVLTIGYGQNTIGRSKSERISIDFGDNEISRNNHSMITFDPRGRAFYIQPGTGVNLAYMNNMAILAPTPLQSHSEVTIGSTKLRFVSFCGSDFSWEDTDDD